LKPDNTESQIGILERLTKLRDSARSCQQRWLVVINGEREWVYELVASILQSSLKQDYLCISNHEFSATVSIRYDKAEQYLGNEFDNIVYDTFDGLFPSTLALCEGTLKGGGLFFLLTPGFENWPSGNDLFKQKYAMYPFSENDMCHYFVTRLIHMIKLQEDISIISQQGEQFFYQPDKITPPAKQPPAGPCQTIEQKEAVDKIMHTAKGHRNRPLVILSNRGRGKSAALGIASAMLMQERTHHITVTGPRKKAIGTVFKHINSTLGLDTHPQANRIVYKQSTVEFVAPDELIRHPVETSLLLIDEAATLPLPLLEALLKHYHRVVFSSTVYGYEGNGRGFEIKFLKVLDKRTPGWTLHKLNDPVRWRHGDALEQFFFKAFLLDPDCDHTIKIKYIDKDHIDCRHLDKTVLVNNESTLRALFGLLTHAHYKTTPNDLRMIIDSPYVSIYGAYVQGQMVAAALVSTEGGIAEDFAIDIMNGHRRISGQFLVQTLISDFAQTKTAHLKFARIMRIAVHPSLHRKGIGSLLLRYLDNELGETHDFIGAGFGSDEGVYHFWEKSGYLPVKIGHKRNAFSGQHSLVVIKGLSENSKIVINDLCQQFPQRLLFLLTDSLKHLDTTLVRLLLVNFAQQIQSQLSEKDILDLNSFAHENRNYNTCAHLIYKLILNSVHRHADINISDSDWAILIQRVIQRQHEMDVVKDCHLKGKNELLDRLRQSTSRLIGKYRAN